VYLRVHLEKILTLQRRVSSELVRFNLKNRDVLKKIDINREKNSTCYCALVKWTLDYSYKRRKTDRDKNF
jgi:hypothetical protein